MSADSDPPAENDATGATEKVEEPYPGFLADMKRMGLTEEEAVAQARKQQNQSKPVRSERIGGGKNLFKPDGTPYAPWMTGISADYTPTVIPNRTDATGKLARDPQQGELSGVGLTWKMLGDDLELSWGTAAEERNVGFVVYRRKGKVDEWEKIADYRNDSALISKGTQGGTYSFIVEEAEPGTWVYRVSDVDTSKNVMDLAQVLVEIESKGDNKLRAIALGVLLAVLLFAVLVGLSLDPQS